MSKDAILAQRGEILGELEEVNTQIGHRTTQAERMAAKLRFIANRLDSKPQKLVFENEETDLRYQSSEVADGSMLDIAKIREARDGIRILLNRQSELIRQRDGR